ncbi:MAG: class I SAM-dependent RNA methyltransferase [Treponemataceae bacterium]
MIITTTKMVSGGLCLAKTEGKKIFVQNALPNETLDIHIISEKKDYSIAGITSIITPSAYRIDPKCVHYGICGGCNLQFANYEYQKELKLSIFNEILERAKIFDIPEIEFVESQEWEYRNRFQLHGNGLKSRSSFKRVPLSDCPIACKELRSFFKAQQENSIVPKNQRTHIFGFDGRVVMQSLFEKQAHSPSDEKHLCSAEILDKVLHFDVRGFFQSNVEMLKKTIPLMQKDVKKGKRVLDLYCGVGTFSVFLADFFEAIYLVEHNQKALLFASKNLVGKNYRSYAIDAKDWKKQKAAQNTFDLVVVDPPRQGLDKELTDFLCDTKPKEIRYLSCDPVTFARDSAKLIASGYSLKKLYLLDYYPQTTHIECLGIFEC